MPTQQSPGHLGPLARVLHLTCQECERHVLPLSVILFFPLHHVLSSTWLSAQLSVLLFECLEGHVFAGEPESSFLLEVGLCLWGFGGQWWWCAHRCCFLQVLNTDRNGPFKGSHSEWGCGTSTVQLAFRQLCSHSFLALSFYYRLPLLSSLIAFTPILDMSVMSQ